MRILNHGRIDRTVHVCPNDEFILEVDGKVVHSQKISKSMVVSHWALVEVGTSLGYFIGDESLLNDLGNLAG